MGATAARDTAVSYREVATVAEPVTTLRAAWNICSGLRVGAEHRHPPVAQP